MKKVLLTLAVALIAMSSYAKHPVKVGLEKKTFKSENILKKHAGFTISNDIQSTMKATVAKKAARVAKKADTDNNVFGVYTQIWAGETIEDFVGVCTDTIWNADKTIDVAIDNEGNTQPVHCNIALKNIFANWYCGEYFGVFAKGEQDGEEYNYITFPSDQLFNHVDGVSQTTGAEYHYNIYMYGLDLTEDGTQIAGIYDPTFIEEDGVFYCASDGLGFYYEDSTTGEALGWGAFVWETNLLQTNATTTYYTTSQDNEGNIIRNDFKDISTVEDWGASITLYGWNGTALSININEDLSVSIPVGTPIYDEIISAEDGYLWDAGTIVTRGVKYEEDEEEPGTYFVRLDLDATEIKGELDGDTIFIPHIYTSSENGGTGDYAGYYYGLNLYRDIRIVLNEGLHFTAGVKEVAMTREDKIKNTKTYNLMGQQVNRDAMRGLMIREGKKYFKK